MAKLNKYNLYFFPFFVFIIIFTVGAILKVLLSKYFQDPIPTIIFKSFTLISFLSCCYLFLKTKKIFSIKNFNKKHILIILTLFFLFIITNLTSLTFSDKSDYIYTLKSTLFLSIVSITINSISEEVIYRGFIQTYINERNPSSAIISKGNIIASILMWLTHLGFYTVMEPLFASIALVLVAISTITLGYLRDKTGGILIPIVVHIICNYIHLTTHLIY